jgi:hypothetical protein
MDRRLILLCAVLLSCLWVATGSANDPRFFAISADFGSSDDYVIAFHANGDVSWQDLIPGTPTFLATDGISLFTTLEGDVAKRSVVNSAPFEPLAACGSCTQIQLDHAGNIYAGHNRAPGFRRYDPAGVVTLDIPLADSAWGIDADANGQVFVTQQTPGSDQLHRYSSSGILESITTTSIEFASSMAIDELNQRLYLGDQQGSVEVYDISIQDPVRIATWDTQGLDLLLDIALDHLTGHIFVAGVGGIIELDSDGQTLHHFFETGFLKSGVAASPLPNGDGADYNGDDQLDQIDLDVMVRAIASGENRPAFDISGDGRVDADDRDAWLVVAAAQNLPAGQTYAVGDANLDGVVDGLDFAAWNANKFQRLAAWSKGDFTGNGIIDGLDFILWNENKDFPNTPNVPEPQTSFLLLMGVIGRRFRGNKKASGTF